MQRLGHGLTPATVCLERSRQVPLIAYTVNFACARPNRRARTSITGNALTTGTWPVSSLLQVSTFACGGVQHTAFKWRDQCHKLVTVSGARA